MKLGADHPDIFSITNNLPGLYTALERYDKAEPLFLHCFKIRTAKLGANHSDALSSINNLAIVEVGRG